MSPIPPSDSALTVYDEEHIITYLRLFDADAQRADGREAARVALHLDPEHESDRARRAFESHLSRAKWKTEHGYRHLLPRWQRMDRPLKAATLIFLSQALTAI
jgi:Uncharacterized conserved protein (DUF2285)